MQTRITVNLPDHDYRALVCMAQEELRSPRAQLLFILQKEARLRGLLTSDVEAEQVLSFGGRKSHAVTINNEG